jgi:hypothetical protein
MKTRTKPMFPRLRLLMMLFMLVSMVSSLSFTASAAQTNGIAGPTVELCLALDANDNMVLTDAEASALETDLNGDQVVNQADVNLLMRFCADVQSFSVAPIGDPGGAYGKIGICKATASATNPFVYIEVNGAATSEKNQELIDDFVDSFPNSFAAPPGVDSTEECNTYEPPWAGIVVQKFFCLDLECSLPFAEFQTSPIVSFAIYQGEDTTAQPLVTRDLVDLADGADGFTVELEGFGDGDVVTICETKVTGADTWATSIECQSRELYTGDYIEVEFYNFQNEEERPNLLVLEKYYCEGTDLEGPTTTAYLGGDEYDLDACEKGVAEFVIADDEGNPLDLDLSTLFTTGVELMPGAYGLWEVVGEELVLVVEFEIGGGETVSFTVLNPVEDAPTVDLHIYKEVCKDVDGFDEINPCVPSDAMDGHTLYFTVFALAGDVDDEQIGVIDVVEVELVID